MAAVKKQDGLADCFSACLGSFISIITHGWIRTSDVGSLQSGNVWYTPER